MAGWQKTSTLCATKLAQLYHYYKLRMVLASGALLNKIGRELVVVSRKLTIILYSLTSIKKEFFLPERVRRKSDISQFTQDQILDLMN